MIDLHYCGDFLKEFAVFSEAKSCCPQENEDHKGCCSNESVYVAFDEDQMPLMLSVFKFYAYKAEQVSIPSFVYTQEKQAKGTVNLSNAPPIVGQKIYLQLSRLKVLVIVRTDLGFY